MANQAYVRYPPRGQRDEGMGEISGFGGGYESACWNGLRAGLAWLEKHPDWEFDDGSSIWDAQNKSLADAIATGCEPGGATGAMVGTCFSHVIHIQAKGWEWWVQQMWERGAEEAAEAAARSS